MECITDLHHGLQFFEKAKNSQERLSIILDLNYDEEDIEEDNEQLEMPYENPLKIDENSIQFTLEENSESDGSLAANVKDEDQEMIQIIKPELDDPEIEEEYLIEEVGIETEEPSVELDEKIPVYDLESISRVTKSRLNLTKNYISEQIEVNNTAKMYIYKCCECEKVYDKKTSLQYHLKTKHSNVRQFKCEFCNKAFAIKSDCVRHTRTHTNEKRFCCSVCGKKFTDRSTHLKHERIHSGNKPYACHMCDKSFGYSFVLKNHLLTHTGAKDFSCPVCEKAFARKSKMKDHLRRVHSLEYNSDGDLVTAQPRGNWLKKQSVVKT